MSEDVIRRSVGFASMSNASWTSSGQNAFFMWDGLQQVRGVRKVPCFPMKLSGLSRILIAARNRTLVLMGGNSAPVMVSTMAQSRYRRELERAQQNGALAIIANQPLIVADSPIPYVLFVDGHIHGLMRMGGYYSDWSKKAIETGIRIERRAIEGAAAVYTSSSWARTEVLETTSIADEKVLVEPIPANLQFEPSVRAEVEAPDNDSLNLLFFGANYERKGLDTAIEVTLRLRALGVEALLDVFGGPVRTEAPIGVKFHGAVNKSGPSFDSFARTAALAHLFILPTRADCSPVSIPELAAFGVPAIASDVGGVTTTIGNAGIALPVDASIDEWVSTIRHLIDSPTLWIQYRKAAVSQWGAGRNWAALMTRLTDAALESVQAS